MAYHIWICKVYQDKTIAFIDKVNDNLFQNEEYYLITLENSSMENVARLANKKKKERGAFEKKIFLEKVIEE